MFAIDDLISSKASGNQSSWHDKNGKHCVGYQEDMPVIRIHRLYKNRKHS